MTKYYLIKYTQLNVSGTKRYPDQYVMSVMDNMNPTHDWIKEAFRSRHRASKLRIQSVTKISAERAEKIRSERR